MKVWTRTRLLLNVGAALIALCFLSMLTSEYQGKFELRSHAKTGTSFADFKKKYGEPRYAYRNWESLPQAYQQLFIQPSRSEDAYYAYQREGLPSYWSFVVSVNSDSQTVQRYIYWKAIAFKPREGI